MDHIAPPSANYAEQVNIILSGDKSGLPDLVKLNSAMFNDLYDYVDQGALMDMSELVTCDKFRIDQPFLVPASDGLQGFLYLRIGNLGF